jgi:hypothetical protein
LVSGRHSADTTLVAKKTGECPVPDTSAFNFTFQVGNTHTALNWRSSCISSVGKTARGEDTARAIHGDEVVSAKGMGEKVKAPNLRRRGFTCGEPFFRPSDKQSSALVRRSCAAGGGVSLGKLRHRRSGPTRFRPRASKLEESKVQEAGRLRGRVGSWARREPWPIFPAFGCSGWCGHFPHERDRRGGGPSVFRSRPGTTSFADGVERYGKTGGSRQRIVQRRRRARGSERREASTEAQDR